MYNHMKLYNGIYKATVSKTSNRLQKVDKVTHETQRDILFLKKKRVSSKEIGEIILKILKSTDIGMFLRFLAYHKDIANIPQMKKELAKYLA